MKLRIKELRDEYQLTQKELAQKLSNVQRNVSNWENGTSEPDCETILRIADLFKVSIDDLFGRDFTLTESINADSDEVISLTRIIRKLNSEQRLAIKKLILSFIK